jgi:hypothetical protein
LVLTEPDGRRLLIQTFHCQFVSRLHSILLLPQGQNWL